MSIHIVANFVAVFCLFSWLNSIPLCICTISSLFNPLSKDTLVISRFWPRRIMLQWTQGYIYLCEYMFFSLLGRYTEKELLGHMVPLLILWGTTRLSPLFFYLSWWKKFHKFICFGRKSDFQSWVWLNIFHSRLEPQILWHLLWNLPNIPPWKFYNILISSKLTLKLFTHLLLCGLCMNSVK